MAGVFVLEKPEEVSPWRRRKTHRDYVVDVTELPPVTPFNLFDAYRFRHEYAPDSAGLDWTDPHMTYNADVLSAYRHYLKRVIKYDNGVVHFNDMVCTRGKRVPDLRFPVIVRIDRRSWTVPVPDMILLRYAGYIRDQPLMTEDAALVLYGVRPREAAMRILGNMRKPPLMSRDQALSQMNELYTPENTKSARPLRPKPTDDPQLEALRTVVVDNNNQLEEAMMRFAEPMYANKLLKLDHRLADLCSKTPLLDGQYREIVEDLGERRDYELVRNEAWERYRENRATEVFYNSVLGTYTQMCKVSVANLVKLKNYLLLQRESLDLGEINSKTRKRDAAVDITSFMGTDEEFRELIENYVRIVGSKDEDEDEDEEDRRRERRYEPPVGLSQEEVLQDLEKMGRPLLM